MKSRECGFRVVELNKSTTTFIRMEKQENVLTKKHRPFNESRNKKNGKKNIEIKHLDNAQTQKYVTKKLR